MSVDRFVIEFDRAFRSVFGSPRSARPVPGDAVEEVVLSEEDRRHAAGLMRINHCGEICAQALYQGQSLTSTAEETRLSLQQAADEEMEHLAWTEQRLKSLGSHKSVFNPLFYVGSLMLGALAGKFGDRWSLGFLAETERQVEAHIDAHLAMLPAQDLKSKAVLAQMREDEIRHADMAVRSGGVPLPGPVKQGMRLSSRLMTWLTYRC